MEFSIIMYKSHLILEVASHNVRIRTADFTIFSTVSSDHCLCYFPSGSLFFFFFFFFFFFDHPHFTSGITYK